MTEQGVEIGGESKRAPDHSRVEPRRAEATLPEVATRAMELAVELERAGREFAAQAPHSERDPAEIHAYLELRERLLASLGELNLPGVKGAARERLRELLVQVQEYDQAVIRAAGHELQQLRRQLGHASTGRAAVRGYAAAQPTIAAAYDRDV